MQLLIQKNTAGGNEAIEDSNSHPKHRALGYVYGYIDAALRADGHDMANTSIGGPIMYHAPLSSRHER
jgi:hypothetical protein